MHMAICGYLIKHEYLKSIFPDVGNAYGLMSFMDRWYMVALNKEQRKQLPQFEYPFQLSLPAEQGLNKADIAMMTRIIRPPVVLNDAMLEETEQDRVYKANFIKFFKETKNVELDETRVEFKVMPGQWI